MKSHQYYVYILASGSGTLYAGVTNNLIRRVYEHKENLVEGFTKKYQCHRLVLFEESSDIKSALEREKQIKKWRRSKKEDLISNKNPNWNDLYQELL